MHELIQESITPYNLPLTVLLGLALLYWITAALGIVDLDSSADVELETDIDADADADAGGSFSFLGAALKFINADRVPLMIVLSILAVFLWMIALALNSYLNPGRSFALALAYLLPNLIASTLLTKTATLPLRAVFSKISLQGETHEPVVGRTGVVKSADVTQAHGQVEIPTGSSPLLVNARLAEGETTPITKGTQVLIFRHDKENNLYHIRHA